MKKKIMYVGIGIGMYFVLSIILDVILGDTELGYQVAGAICGIYCITLTIITYIKNLVSYFKTGQFPDKSSLIIWIMGIMAITTGKSPTTSFVMMEGANTSSKEFNKVNDKIGILVYTLFYITLWCLIGFMFYELVFKPNDVDMMVDIFLTTGFISLAIAIVIVLIFGAIANMKERKRIEQKREAEYKRPTIINEFSCDSKVFRKHYAMPYYALAAFICIGGIIIIIYNCISSTNIFDLINFDFRKYIYFVIFLAVAYFPISFPKIISNLKLKCLRQHITLNPLKIKMVPKDGNDELGNYIRIEKTYYVDAISSYKITNRWIIITGKIRVVIQKTTYGKINEKSKDINTLKIPRIFNNEDSLIEYFKTLNMGSNFR